MTKEKTSKMANNKPRSGRRKAGRVNASKASCQGISKPSATNLVQVPMLTHEQVAKRAKKIWQDRGCVPGFDEQNWYEAETQLKVELEVH
jgi:hypothetical protein